MNRGLQIRAKKLSKKTQKRNTIKPNQVGVCRFIDFKNPETGMKNGKLDFLGFHNVFGLQVEHKLYYIEDGKEHWLYINKKRASILTVYSENEIENFDPILLKRYHDFKSKQENAISISE